VDEAVIIIRPALWHHPFTIYTCILALLMEKIFDVTPTSPKAITCWISQILNIHFTCIEYLWSMESENHIGLKKRIVVLNRLFHGTLQLLVEMCAWEMLSSGQKVLWTNCENFYIVIVRRRFWDSTALKFILLRSLSWDPDIKVSVSVSTAEWQGLIHSRMQQILRKWKTEYISTIPVGCGSMDMDNSLNSLLALSNYCFFI